MTRLVPGACGPPALRRGMFVCVVLATACGSRLDVGLGAAASDTTSASSGSSGPVRETATEGGTTTGVGTSTSGSTSTSAGATTESGSESGGIDESPCASEQKVCAEVELDGEPVGFCGQTLELKGIAQPLGPGRWSIEDCSACELCGGSTYEIRFVAPPGWTPIELPLCSRISIDFAPLAVSPFACAFTGVAIWGDDGTGEDPAPVYVAASIRTDPPAAFTGLQVAKHDIEPKPCDMSSCCYEQPGKYELEFSGAGIGMPIILLEHEEALDVGALGLSYDLRVESAHVDVQCDRIPHFDWMLLR